MYFGGKSRSPGKLSYCNDKVYGIKIRGGIGYPFFCINIIQLHLFQKGAIKASSLLNIPKGIENDCLAYTDKQNFDYKFPDCGDNPDHLYSTTPFSFVPLCIIYIVNCTNTTCA